MSVGWKEGAVLLPSESIDEANPELRVLSERSDFVKVEDVSHVSGYQRFSPRSDRHR